MNIRMHIMRRILKDKIARNPLDLACVENNFMEVWCFFFLTIWTKHVDEIYISLNWISKLIEKNVKHQQYRRILWNDFFELRWYSLWYLINIKSTISFNQYIWNILWNNFNDSSKLQIWIIMIWIIRAILKECDAPFRAIFSLLIVECMFVKRQEISSKSFYVSSLRNR